MSKPPTNTVIDYTEQDFFELIQDKIFGGKQIKIEYRDASGPCDVSRVKVTIPSTGKQPVDFTE